MTPGHIAIILDGNRRFAKKLMQQPWKGHQWGRGKVELLLDWCKELDIKEVTLYVFSLQNFNRPKEEFDHLMEIFKDAFTSLITDERIKDVRVRFIGHIDLFPKEVTHIMQRLQTQTSKNVPFTLNLCMAYGGREEITDAISRIAKDVRAGVVSAEGVDEALVSTYLSLSSSPDMVIRTGGEKRTSNFLPWQCIYSEWFFLDKTWPEFEKVDLVQCISEFNSRQRRFGV
jgi:tritrans,polycis-undecaprenyl-diphosphate synthase [geranylgeranyl-diphosphate specific]